LKSSVCFDSGFPYGASKLAFENALEAYSTAYGLRFVSFRYFNAAGADEGGTTGENHDPGRIDLVNAVGETAAGILFICRERNVIGKSEAASKLDLLAKYGRYKNTIVEDVRARLEEYP